MSLGLDEAVVSRFGASLDRCVQDPTFLQRFYARFLLTDEGVAERFAGVDMGRQQSVLRASLYLVLRAASGFADGLDHLDDVARTHAERGYDIRPFHYEHWLTTLLEVVRETDPDYDPVVGEAWQTTLRVCVDRMLAHREG